MNGYNISSKKLAFLFNLRESQEKNQQAEDDLKKAKEHLEVRVEERTVNPVEVFEDKELEV